MDINIHKVLYLVHFGPKLEYNTSIRARYFKNYVNHIDINK